MHAGCRGCNAGDGGELGSGAGAAIHEARKHAGTGRLADRGGDIRDSET
jgi:hypothetical protein